MLNPFFLHYSLQGVFKHLHTFESNFIRVNIHSNGLFNDREKKEVKKRSRYLLYGVLGKCYSLNSLLYA